jgi:pyocin large subunit-like protein
MTTKPGISRGEDVWVAASAKELTHWGHAKTLEDHFARHGKDFDAKSADDYAKQASDFFRRCRAERLPTKIGPDGVIRVYDPRSNSFGSFDPQRNHEDVLQAVASRYFDSQPGNPPWEP